MRYPIEWRGQHYTLGPITVGHKVDYVEKFRLKLLMDAVRDLPVSDAQANAIRMINANPPWWTDGVCSEDVLASFDSQWGNATLHRMLLCEKGNLLTDAEIHAMVREKQKQPASDYTVAMKANREKIDPPVSGSLSSGDQTGAKSSGP